MKNIFQFHFLVVLVLFAANVSAQPGSILTLQELREAAIASDPRGRQLMLERQMSELRLENLRSNQRTRVDLSSKATYQTDVTTVPVTAPVGGSVPAPPKEQFEIAVEAEKILYDWGRLSQRERSEQAELAEKLAGVEAALDGVRRSVDQAFFTAAELEERLRLVGTLLEALESRRELVAARARHGAALASDVAAVDAQIIAAHQDRLEIEARRLTAIAALEDLAGIDIDPSQQFQLPEADSDELIDQVESDDGLAFDGTGKAVGVRVELSALANRPEIRRIDLARERILEEAANAELDGKPRASAFGKAAYGQPGLNFLSDDPDFYGIAGIRLSLPLLDHDRARRQAQVLRLQAESLLAERDAALESLSREGTRLSYEIMRLSSTLELDLRAIELREQIERVALRQLEEGARLPSDYVDVLTDLHEARVLQAIHVVELVRNQTALATLFGRETLTRGELLVQISAPGLHPAGETEAQ